MLLIATNNGHQQAQVNHKCQYFDHNAMLNTVIANICKQKRSGLLKNLKLKFLSLKLMQ